jgi:queuine tRNA-ribosyltransferase
MSFELLATDGKARRGRLTFRAAVETPAFMPVGTYGTVKGMLPRDIEAIGAEIILGNTFHLWLRPGTEVIKKHGGLHDFMQWKARSSPTPVVSRCSAWAPCARSRKRA